MSKARRSCSRSPQACSGRLLVAGIIAGAVGNVDRNRITVADYLDDWINGHAMEIKPRTLLDHRACIRLYVTPRIGYLPIQAVRPSTITKARHARQ